MERHAALIPFRVDSPERLRNLSAVVQWYRRFMQVYLLEESVVPASHWHGVKHMHVPWSGPFHQTRNRNILASVAESQGHNIFFHLDADVLLKEVQIRHALGLLTSGQADVVWPYDGKFDRAEPGLSAQLCADPSRVEQLGRIFGASEDSPQLSFGGVWAIRVDAFWHAGGENENLVSWGFNDWCRKHRYTELGLRIARCPGPLYHLHHPDSLDSGRSRQDTYASNATEYERIAAMKYPELLEELSRWTWASPQERARRAAAF